MNTSNQPEHPAYLPADDIVSVILFCPSLLERISLQTMINSIPTARVVARSADVESMVQLIQKHIPDILLADAYFPLEELTDLLEQAKEASPTMLRVVLLPESAPEQAYRPLYADFVMNQGNLTQQFTEVVDRVKAKRENNARDH